MVRVAAAFADGRHLATNTYPSKWWLLSRSGWWPLWMTGSPPHPVGLRSPTRGPNADRGAWTRAASGVWTRATWGWGSGRGRR
jgi:hypothetical protein